MRSIRLIGPYIDKALARKLHKRWLPPVSTKPKPWRSFDAISVIHDTSLIRWLLASPAGPLNWSAADIGSGHLDHAAPPGANLARNRLPPLEIRQRPRDGLDRQAQIIRDVLARHRQFDVLACRHAIRHFQQKFSNALSRSLDQHAAHAPERASIHQLHRPAVPARSPCHARPAPTAYFA